jgi:hypothetical protein
MAFFLVFTKRRNGPVSETGMEGAASCRGCLDQCAGLDMRIDR